MLLRICRNCLLVICWLIFRALQSCECSSRDEVQTECPLGTLPAVLENFADGRMNLICKAQPCLKNSAIRCSAKNKCDSQEFVMSWHENQRLKYHCCRSSNVIVSNLVRTGVVLPGKMAIFGGYRNGDHLYSDVPVNLERFQRTIVIEIARIACSPQTANVKSVPEHMLMTSRSVPRSRRKRAFAWNGKVVEDRCNGNWGSMIDTLPGYRRRRKQQTEKTKSMCNTQVTSISGSRVYV